MAKHKILYVTNDSVTYGSTRSTLNLMDEMLKKDLDIQVLIPQKGPLEEELKNRNINYKVSRYFSWVKSKNDKNILKMCIKMLLNIFLLIPICSWIKREKFDIIHSVNSAVCIGAFSAKILKLKHVWHIRELIEEDHNLSFFNKKLFIKYLNNADEIIYVSKNVESKYKKLLNNCNANVIYNGIPIYKEKETELPILQNKFNLLIAGNICETKGQLEAIKAIEYLVSINIKNIKLYVAGDGLLEEEYKKYVVDHNLEEYVEFLGFVKNLKELRKRINIYLMCSKNEAFGRVTIEAMVAKNLVIGTNKGGTTEIIQNNVTGILYNQGDFIDLSDKIRVSIEDWEKSKKIINNAYKYAIKNFTIERCADEVYKIYEKMEDKKCIK